MNRLVTVGILIGFLLVASLQCWPYEIRLGLPEITQAADLIYVGTVLAENTRLSGTGTSVVTDVVFGDIWQLHARATSAQQGQQTVVLTQAGGTYGDVQLQVSGVPTFQIGRRYLVCILDDGRTYLSPVVGGTQGVFEVIVDDASGGAYVFTTEGKAVIGVDNDGFVQAGWDALGIQDRQQERSDFSGRFYDVPPVGSDSGEPATISYPEIERIGPPMKLEDFVNYLLSVALQQAVGSPRIQLHQEEEGSSPGAGASPAESPDEGSSTMPDEGEQEVPFGSGTQLETRTGVGGPQQGASAVSASLSEAVPKGGTLGACGYYTLFLVMEQVPSSWWSYSIHDSCMGLWSQFMDIYRYTDDDGHYGNQNGQNEFCGFPSDADVYSVYGFHWGTGLAVCYQWSYASCGRITESDIMWNPAYSWTSDADYALGNSSVILLRPVAMHELGHSWGLQMGAYAESYDYDEPTVMHAYYHDVVENGRGIHAADAYLIRRNYDDQTSIRSITDVGVESYYASDGLNNSTTNATSYSPGTSMTFRNVTIENMSYSAISDVRIRFYLSANNTISTGDYQIGSYWYWSSFPGEAYSVGSYTATVPSNIPAGTYYVGAIVSVNGFNSDSYSSNNSTFFYHTVSIVATPHTVSAPNTPSGSSSGDVGQSLSYSTGGASCSQGHSVQYRFDWDDGTYSSWSSSTSASKSWSAAGSYHVLAQARCATTTSIVSSWSSAKTVTISQPHTVSTPSVPSGPSSGLLGASLGYSTGSATCNQGHSVQYRFDWDDATFSSWSSSASASHAFAAVGTYHLRSQARCASDNAVTSAWSSTKTLTVCTIPAAPSAPVASDGTYSNKVRISWSLISGATKYEIHRATALCGTYTKIGESTGSMYDDLSVAAGQVFWYKVKACTLCGCGSLSSANSGYSIASGTDTSAVFGVDSAGNVRADAGFYGSCYYSGAADVAEWVTVSELVEPGDVLELDPGNPGHYRRAVGPCSSLVAGVVSSEPAMSLGGVGVAGQALLALVGMVPVKACDENGPIALGDLVVPSSIPGYVMRWDDERFPSCTPVGKALQELSSGAGAILILLMR